VGFLCGNGCRNGVTLEDAGQAAFAVSWNWKLRTDAYMHEMGHNQGMHHAGDEDGNEYADKSNFMGFAAAELKCTNSPHMRYLGWTDAADRVTHDPATEGTKRFELQSLSSNHRGGTDLGRISTVLVRTNELVGNLYVAYRGQSNGDVGLSSKFANKVEVIFAKSSNSITRRQLPSLDLDTAEKSGQ
jgi:hypothetical protein